MSVFRQNNTLPQSQATNLPQNDLFKKQPQSTQQSAAIQTPGVVVTENGVVQPKTAPEEPSTWETIKTGTRDYLKKRMENGPQGGGVDFSSNQSQQEGAQIVQSNAQADLDFGQTRQLDPSVAALYNPFAQQGSAPTASTMTQGFSGFQGF